MARPYSNDFLQTLNARDPERLGVQMAKICVRANLPALYVAQAFGVSRMSIHSWFRGQYIRDKNCAKIKNFMSIVQAEIDKGILPVYTLKEAKYFIENMISNKI